MAERKTISMAFNHGCTIAAEIDTASGVSVWDVGSRRTLFGPDHLVSRATVAIDRAGAKIAYAQQDGSVRVVEVGLGAVRPQANPGARIESLAFSGDGRLLFGGDATGAIHIWDTPSGDLVRRIGDTGNTPGFGNVVRALAVDSLGDRILTAHFDGAARLWRSDGTSTVIARGPSLACVAVASQRNLLAIGDRDGTVTLCGEQTTRHSSHADSVSALAFSADGELLVSGSRDRSVQLMNTRTGALQHQLRGLNGWITAVGFGVDDNTVVAGDGDGFAAVWSAQTGELLALSRRIPPLPSASDATSLPAWQREASRHDWSTLRCGCPRGGRHVPGSFQALVNARTQDDANGTGLVDDVETQSMLFEAAVPVAAMAIKALGEETLHPAVRFRLLDLLTAFVNGESHHTEARLGRPNLEMECREAIRGDAGVLIGEIERKAAPGCAERAQEILAALNE